MHTPFTLPLCDIKIETVNKIRNIIIYKQRRMAEVCGYLI
jgi:hypothetical protein